MHAEHCSRPLTSGREGGRYTPQTRKKANAGWQSGVS